MEKEDHKSTASWRLEAMTDRTTKTQVMSLSPALRSNEKPPKAPQLVSSRSLDQELQDLCYVGDSTLLLENGEPEDSSATSDLKSYSCARSSWENLQWNGSKSEISSDHAAKLGRNYKKSANDDLFFRDGAENLQETIKLYTYESDSPASPIGIARNGCSKARRKLYKQMSWSSDMDRDKLWERRKDFHARRSITPVSRLRGEGKSLLRSISDCGDTTWPEEYSSKSVSRTKSLADEDLEELRGCIDLGFGFSNQADRRLWDTLPALELCYAISQQLKNEQSRLSPTSVLENNAMTSSQKHRSTMASPAAGSWVVSSPGDHPQEVKTRLRHWAKAVAFTVSQGF